MQPPNPYLMNTYVRQPVSFVRGSGMALWDMQGREYLDAMSGVAVTNLGHSHPEIAQIIAEQAGVLLHTSNNFGIVWQERLGERLCSISGMDRAFFCNSGAEANEAALKLARLHSRRRGIENPQVVVMENSFHGRTLATLAATGDPSVQAGFEPLMSGFIRVPYNDIPAILAEAERSSNIVAVLVEPVLGQGGVQVASPEYFQSLRALCNEHNWLFMVDEVQTGMGRTGAWFGYQHTGVLPDVITVAKGLGNGFPIGACLAKGEAARLFAPGHHGSTFGGSPLACRIGCTVIDIMERDEVPQRAARLGYRLFSGLRQSLAEVPGVVAIRGHGLMAGIELNRPCNEIARRALDDEKMILNIVCNNTIRLLPPLICDESQIDDIINRVTRLVRRELEAMEL